VVKKLVNAVELGLFDETAKTENFWDRDSTEIWHLIQLLADQRLELPVPLESQDAQAAQEEPIAKHGSSEDRIELKRVCKQRARACAANGNWTEYDLITTKKCVACLTKLELGRTFLVTSCHIYCEICYESLDSIPGSGEKFCLECGKGITNAAKFHPERLRCPNEAPSISLMFPGKKRARNGSGKPSTRKAPKTGGMFSRKEGDDEPAESEEEPIDWIPLLQEYHLGVNWLGSKMTKIRDVIQAWLREDGTNKIVIFTDFLNSQRILEIVCEEENWNYTKVRAPGVTMMAFCFPGY